jgi:hypothetical protein
LKSKGTLENLAGKTFQINHLNVDFAGVTNRNGTLANGIPAEVKGDNLVGSWDQIEFEDYY